MSKGSGTRSGLLWEVERLLYECKELPEILLMENVPNVHGKANIADFENWIKSLEDLGYTNFWKDLNAKNYGVAQNRNRTFMVSILQQNVIYKFPEPFPLKKTMKDYLEDEVDERYYINSEKAKQLIDKLVAGETTEEIKNYGNRNSNYTPYEGAISYPLHSQDFVRTGFMDNAPTLSSRDYKDPKIVLEKYE